MGKMIIREKKSIHPHKYTHTQHERQLKKATCTVLTEVARFKCKFHGEADAEEYQKTARSRKTTKKKEILFGREILGERGM